MNTDAAPKMFVIAERFDKAVKLIRGALSDSELSIVGEVEAAEALPGRKGSRSRILFVDCPLLVFEATVLDRAAGVYFPLHVLVSQEGDGTRVSLVSPSDIFDVRPPLGAADPMERLRGRVTSALELVLQRSGANHG